MQGLGRFLARLGGANLDVLAREMTVSKSQASKDSARFVSLGLVLLSSSSLVALSIAFVLTDGLRLSPAIATLIGLLAGLIALILDRELIVNLRPTASTLLRLSMIVSRLVMAALLATVASVPLTLRIFQNEINEQMAIDNINAAEAAAKVILSGDRQKRLEALNAEIARYEKYLAGDVPLVSPEIEAADAEYQRAGADYLAKQDAANDAREVWRCALDGQFCEVGSGKIGNGPQLELLKREYERRQAEADAAKSVFQQKQDLLANAQAIARAQNPIKVAQAQAEANRALPGLRLERDSLQTSVEDELEASRTAAAENIGLIAQMRALSHLGDKNGVIRWVCLLLAVVLLLLEMLPITTKALAGLGPPTLYDQIDDLDTAEIVRQAREPSRVDTDVQHEVMAGIERALHGPPLVNYDGWINVTAGEAAGVTLSSSPRCLTLDVPGPFDVTVTIAPDEGGEVSERLVVTGGRDAAEVEFTVEVDSDRASLRHPPVRLRLDAGDGTASATFAFDLADDHSDATPWLWIRVSQARRTLQNVELSLEVAPADSNADAQPAPFGRRLR